MFTGDAGPEQSLVSFIIFIWPPFLSSADFTKLTFSKDYFRNMTRVSNGMNLDQVRCSVGPNLGQNCLQRLSAYNKITCLQGNSLV